ncbi:MAG: hypothetical protein CMC48_03345 [Flavobacteriaceae bacterium]|nr:hypothetical protein [Flavobacteriaceae bacterium]
MKNGISILLFFLIGGFYGSAQLSKIHYIPPVSFADDGGARPNRGQYLYISTPSVTDVNVVITPIGGVPVAVTVRNNNPYRYEIQASGGLGPSQVALVANNSNQTARVHVDKGYIIQAVENEIYVALRIFGGGGIQAGALVSKGGAALGTQFRAGSFTNYDPSVAFVSFISVMGTEAGTILTINNIDENVDLVDVDEGALGSNAFNQLNDIVVNLNSGDTFTLATISTDGGDVPDALEADINHKFNGDGLIGANITSTKPVVVNSGSMDGSFSDAGGGEKDYGIDQLVDVSKVGTEYIFRKGRDLPGDDREDAFENVLLVATTDNTSITIGGNPVTNASRYLKSINVSNDRFPVTANTTITAGEYFLIEGDMYDANNNMYVKASNPVYAFQGIAYGGGANQGLFFVPPLKCSSKGDVNNIPLIDEIGNEPFDETVNIITKAGANISLTDNNNTNEPIGTLNVAAVVGPLPVDGNINYRTYSVTGLNGNVSIFGDDELYVSYYNFKAQATSGGFYSGFSSPPEKPSEINDGSVFGYCAPNLSLQAGNMDNFTSWEWMLDPGNGYTKIVGYDNQQTVSTTIAGNYKIRGYINCPGEPVEFLDSDYVSVVLCPPDSDGDGIQDSLDDCPFTPGSALLKGCPQPLIIGNNYKTSVVTGTIRIIEEGYFCSQFLSGHFNRAYHSGTNINPEVGDYIIYNNRQLFESQFAFGENFAYMYLPDFTVIVEVQKSNGEIVAMYPCN